MKNPAARAVKRVGLGSRPMAGDSRSGAMVNLLVWWAYRTEEERNEIREALLKHGPSSKDYNDLNVILFSDCEVVRQALLDRYRVQGTGAPLELGLAASHGGYSCIASLLRWKRRKLLSANGRRRAQKNPKVVLRVDVQDETDESGKPRVSVVIAFRTWALRRSA